MNFFILYPSIPLTLVLVLVIAARWFLVPDDRRRTEWLLAVSTLAIPAGAIAEWMAGELTHLRPLKYDEFVYQLDTLFGQPSFMLGRLVQHHTSLIVLVSVSYGLLPIAVVGTFAVYLFNRSKRESVALLKTFVFSLVAAVPFYLLFPVCGPQFAFSMFPNQMPLHLEPHLLALSAAPNGVPSVHTSTALLILWFLRPWRWGRYLGLIFLVLTMLATLGSGQHYFFDLLVAIPYAAAVYWFSYGRLFVPDKQAERCAASIVVPGF